MVDHCSFCCSAACGDWAHCVGNGHEFFDDVRALLCWQANHIHVGANSPRNLIHQGGSISCSGTDKDRLGQKGWQLFLISCFCTISSGNGPVGTSAKDPTLNPKSSLESRSTFCDVSLMIHQAPSFWVLPIFRAELAKVAQQWSLEVDMMWRWNP